MDIEVLFVANDPDNEKRVRVSSNSNPTSPIWQTTKCYTILSINAYCLRHEICIYTVQTIVTMS